MEMETISMEIVKIRSRLREIEKQRDEVSEDDLETKTDLHDEEIELRARLAELQDMTTATGKARDDIASGKKGKSNPEEFISPA
jgi:predicted  nucleic acid-binding Zn-ribbon protein